MAAGPFDLAKGIGGRYTHGGFRPSRYEMPDHDNYRATPVIGSSGADILSQREPEPNTVSGASITLPRRRE